jgi:hypothetical protein
MGSKAVDDSMLPDSYNRPGLARRRMIMLRKTGTVGSCPGCEYANSGLCVTPIILQYGTTSITRPKAPQISIV